MRHSFLHSIFDPNDYHSYYAHCHCGAIRYKADVSPPLPDQGGDHEVLTCNDSMCMRTGSLNVYIPVEKVTWIQGKEKLKSYQYLSMLRHFCPDCGVQMTISPADPDHECAGVIALNVRTFQDMDYDKLKILYADMKHEEPQYHVDAIPVS